MLIFLTVFFSMFSAKLVIPGLILIMGGVGSADRGNEGVWIFLTGLILCILSFYI